MLILVIQTRILYVISSLTIIYVDFNRGDTYVLMCQNLEKQH